MFWFTAAFGDFPLRITSITTEDGRDIVVQTPARGSKHFNQDRGAKVGTVNAEIVFVDEPGATDFRDRFESFRSLISDGEPKVFSHPVIGAYMARCHGGSHTADPRNMITFAVTFTPENEPQTVARALAGVAPMAGVQALQVASQEADDAIAEADLASAAPGNTLARVQGWSDARDAGTLDSQDVIVGVESAVAEINQAIDDLECASQIERWPAYVALVNLAYATRRVADSFTSSSERMIPFTVVEPQPLLAICAYVYGADRAVDMAPLVARRNRIRSPGLVPPGVIAMPGV
jgi:HPt (histidine-containing phosphotransfer) domain-containing protein